MIPVEDITKVQRQFLEEKYGLDLEKCVSSARQRNRHRMKFYLIFALFAVALYWEGTSDVMASSFKPFGIISWCVFGFFLWPELEHGGFSGKTPDPIPWKILYPIHPLLEIPGAHLLREASVSRHPYTSLLYGL